VKKISFVYSQQEIVCAQKIMQVKAPAKKWS